MFKSLTSRAYSTRRPFFEALEPRWLLSADLPGLAIPIDGTHVTAVSAVQEAPAVQRQEIAFIDGGLPDAAALARDMESDTPERHLEVVVLDPSADGFAQVSAELAKRQGLDAVHLIGHGTDGSITLGTSLLDAGEATRRAATLVRWHSALKADADILLYGCRSAYGIGGERLLQTLADLTGADVAGSVDATGARDLGGNWVLERQAGRVEAALALSLRMQHRYPVLLDNGVAGGEAQANSIATDTESLQADVLKQVPVADSQPLRREIVFIDGRVPDALALTTGITAQSDPTRQIEVVRLDANRDGIEQVGAVLAARQDISAVHLVSHGADGRIEFGSIVLALDTLSAQATRIAAWSNAFTDDGDLLIYGCDVASTPDGEALVNALAGLTGADVAASDDLTGATALGGDWILEYRVGAIDTAVAVSADIQRQYAYALAPTVDIARTSGVVVDGAVDATWASAGLNGISTLDTGSSSGPSDVSGTWRALWDGTKLYFLVDVTDNAKINDSPSPWDDDIVEIYVDGDNSKNTSFDGVDDYQYGFRWNDGANTVYAGTNSLTNTVGIQSAIVNTASGYRLEVSIPWTTLNSSPVAGDLLGIEVHIGDDDDGGARDGKVAWASTGDVAYHDPSAFGTARLSPPPVATDDSYSVNEDETLTVGPSSTGLVNWYRMDDGAGQAVMDSGTLGNDGTLGSTAAANTDDPAWNTGTSHVGAAALTFDGTGDHVSTPSTVAKTSSSFTLSAWFKTTTTSGQQILLWEGYSGGNGYGNPGNLASTSEMSLSVGTYDQDNNITFHLGYDVPAGGGDPIYIASSSSFTDTTAWHHAAVTVTDLGGGVFSGKLYVDGVLEGTDTGVQNDRSQWGSLLIGKPGAASRHFSGGIDEVRVYDTALSGGQVQAIAQTGVLQNDSDVDGDPIKVNTGVVTGPSNGTLNLYPDGSFTYTPNLNFAGTDTFTYRANDGTADSNVATVTITVDPVNDAPAAANLSAAETYTEDTPLNLTDIVVSDVDSANVTVTLTLSNTAAGSLNTATSGAVTSTYVAGTGVWTASGAIANVNTLLAGLTFTPSLNFNSGFTITTSVDDGVAPAITGSKALTGTPSNDAPVASDDAYSVNEDGTLNVTWWDTTWQSRQKITFDNTNSTGNLTDFPVLLRLDPGNIDFAKISAAGADIRFLDADGTPLSYQIESWNDTPGSESATVWVKVPQIAAGSNTDFIWMYYNNPTAADAQNAVGVWPAGMGVWHLNQDPGPGAAGDIVDSDLSPTNGTAQANMTSADVVAGKIGNAINFDGVDDFIGFGSTDVGDSFTIEAWIKPDSGSTGIKTILANSVQGNTTNGFRFFINSSGTSDGKIQFETGNGTLGNGASTAVGAINFDAWNHVAVKVDRAAGLAQIYINGIDVTVDQTIRTDFNTSSDWEIGRMEGTLRFDGVIDEVRISNSTRSADWIMASYLAQSGSFAFATFGGEQSAPASGGVLDNDADAEWQALTAVLVVGPANAAGFTLNADGTFSYTPNANFDGTDTFTYRTNDGTANSNVATVTITVNPVNDAPTATNLSAAETYTEGTPLNLTDIVVSDVDSANVTATLTLSNVAAGSLNTATSGAVTSTYNALTGVWTASGAIANVNSLLAGLTFTPSLNFNSSFTIATSVDDGVAPAITGSKAMTGTPVDDAPVLTTTGSTLAYTENAAATAIDPGLGVSDVDSATLAGATVTISANYANGQDVLAFTNQLGITGSWSAATGVLTLTGTTTLANYQTALQSVTYVNTSDNPSTLTRTVSFVVNDGSANSSAATRDISVAAVNDAPTTSAVTLVAIAEDSGARLITQGELLANASDVDGPGLTATSLAITSGSGILVDNGNGTWTYTPVLNDDTSVSFTYTVTDGADSVAATASLDIIAANDAPSLPTATLSVAQSGATTIVGTSFPVTDPDGPAPVFIVQNVVGGYFESVTAPGTPILTFTAAQLASGQIRFVHTGGATAPAFQVSASDGAIATPFINATVSFAPASVVPAEPGILAEFKPPPIIMMEAPAIAGGGTSSTTEALIAAAQSPKTILQATVPPFAVPRKPAAPTPAPQPQSGGGVPGPVAENPNRGTGETTKPGNVAFTLPAVTLPPTNVPAATGLSEPDLPLAARAQLIAELSGVLEDEPEPTRLELALKSAQLASLALSVGVVTWILRAGGLISSLLASLPAWRHMDPLPILAREKEEEENEEARKRRMLAEEQDEKKVDRVLAQV